MSSGITVIALAVAIGVSGCGSGDRGRGAPETPTSVRVPKLSGLQLRDAEDLLAARHLRWRIAPGHRVVSRPEPPNEGSSMDDIPVTGQRPASGTATRAGAVVTVFTPCSAKRPCS